MAELRGALDDADGGHGRLFLISGEPGIGKTRLADELTADARARRMRVVWGRSWDGSGAPAYWPWLQIIRRCLGSHEPGKRHSPIQAQIGPNPGQELAQIIPELRESFPEGPKASTGTDHDPEQARFRLFEAVASMLRNVVETHPTMIVLDDLHDADEGSLVMLRFVARELKDASLLIVGTYRDGEVRRSAALTKLIGDLSRDARSISMGGLSEQEVGVFLERSGVTRDDELVAELYSATDGNPLFVEGVIRLLIADRGQGQSRLSDGVFKIPVDVRAAIRRRIGALSEDTNSLLAVAAVVGKEFEASICQQVVGGSEGIDHWVREATAAGLVTPTGHDAYRFSHNLIRDAVYQEIEPERGAKLHGKIALAIEERHRNDLEPHVDSLAHHFREAGIIDKAIDYSIRAAEAAYNLYAFDIAVAEGKAALDLMREHTSAEEQRAQLLHLLGQAAFETDQASSIRYKKEALAIYERGGNPDKTARLHLDLGRNFSMQTLLVDANRARRHFEQAAAILRNRPESALRGLADFCLSQSAFQAMKVLDGISLAIRAIETAERFGDGNLRCQALSEYALHAAMNGRVSEAFAAWERGLEACGERFSGLSIAWSAGGVTNLMLDPRGARVWYDRELNRPANRHSVWRRQILSILTACSLCAEGDLQRARQVEAPEIQGFLRFWEGGAWEEIAASAEGFSAHFSQKGDGMSLLNCNIDLGNIYLVLEQYARAETHLLKRIDNGEHGALVLYEMRARPILARVYAAMDRLSEADAQLARCREILAAGENWRGLGGHVAHAEGVVAAANGRFQESDLQFQRAATILGQYTMVFEKAEVFYHWGSAILAAGDRVGAGEKFDAAIDIYRRHNISQRFIDRANAARQRSSSAAAGKPASVSVGEIDTIFRREGDVWAIAFEGRRFRLRDMKGLAYIAYLIAHPGARIHVCDLVAKVEGPAADDAGIASLAETHGESLEVVRDLGDAGEVLDARAIAEYRRRLAEVQAELVDAERDHDPGRVERAQHESDQLTSQLTAAVGQGGRHRKSASHVERARSLVTKNIRASLERIRHNDEKLCNHFDSAIHTGAFCAYLPDSEHKPSWQL